MNIIHIDTGRELRGGQRQLLRLARGLSGRHHEQLIACPEGSALEASAREEGHRVFAMPAHDPGHANAVFQLRQELLWHPVHIIHAHDGRGQTISWLSSVGLPVRRVASRRVTFLPNHRLRHRFIYGHTCHAVIAVSQFIRSLLVETGVPADKIEVIPDGIEIPREAFSPENRAQARARQGWNDQDFLIGQIGAFAPEKGQDIAVEAMRWLVGRRPQVRLLLVGHAPEELQARLRGQSESARERVQFLGHIEDLTPFLAAIDVLIMPSRAEGLGSAALMAMAHGVPVIASRVGGLPEIVADGQTGWLIQPGSASALADCITSAASDRAQLRRFGVAAREQAGPYSIEKMVERSETLYRRLRDL